LNKQRLAKLGQTEGAARAVTQRLAVLLLVLFLHVLLPAATAAEITGRVLSIADGDTLTVLDQARHQTRIRLAEIDTPESHQPYGSRAKQALSELAFGKDVRVVVVDIDRYGRTVGRIYAGSIDISAEMVRQGAAWVYRKYNHDPSLLRLEQEPQQARRGLWALPEAERTPPWEWRAAARAARQDR
jgi:endonuclease YncB( thermonuclease family)